MTQLFDTASYDQDEPERHLRSIGTPQAAYPAKRGPMWRLDERTIAIGREGIARAREALRKTTSDDKPAQRKAA